MSVSYTVKTNLPPDMVSKIAISIFTLWVDFALGRASIAGRRLIYPTGRYAASISYQQEGESTVAIVADAPEADILELGHASVDLKQKLRPGAYRMHRRPGQTPGTSLRRVGSGPASLKPRMWAEIRTREANGFASIGVNSPADSWIIPPMPAYSVAMILAAQAQALAAKL